MNWRRTAATAILAAVVLIGLVGCPKKPPATPGAPVGPGSAVMGVAAAYKVATTAKGSIKYAMDWGDGKIDTTSQAYASAESASVSHTWTDSAHLSIRVMAILDADATKASDWSAGTAVVVAYNGAPVIDTLLGPAYTAKGISARYTVVAQDPESDSVKVKMKWGDGKDSTTAFFKSPCTLELTHVFTKVETVQVQAFGIDTKGATGAAKSMGTRVGPAGAVMTYWQNDPDEQASLTTSPVLVSDGSQDCIWAGCEDDGRFYGISVSDLHTRHSGRTKFGIDPGDYVFWGHPAYCAVTAHFIVGSDEGMLYSLKMSSLGADWRWPDWNNEDSADQSEWGAAAIFNNKLYVSHDDDSIFCFIDNGGTVTRRSAYGVNASIVDAPVIDGSGNVLFGTDSGYLYKMQPDLVQPVWRAHLLNNGEIYGPVLDADGTIYCTSDSGLYAINPVNDSVNWMLPLNGEGTRPVVGSDGIYVGTSNGWFYKVSKAAGTTIWQKQLGTYEFATSPIIAANGYVYAQNDLDVLYCIKQADGDTVWVCNCPDALPLARRARTMQITDYPPNPTITADGNIIVVGTDAVYLVKGYPEGPLDPGAPWPKWQKNLLNTGK